jgi:hypothetical protein
MPKRLVLSIVIALCLTANGACQDDFTNSEHHHCGLVGTATSTKGKTLNKLKNRYDPPATSDIDEDATLERILAPGDDVDRFDESKAAKIVGFVVDAKVGGRAETCNCEATQEIDCDTHIELALSENAPKNQRVVVEVTPRLRATKGDTWKTSELRSHEHGIKGRWVEVTGWLMFDTMHVNQAENTLPGGDHNWRATCWEIHPITNFRILEGPPEGTHIVHPQVMHSFQAAQTAPLRRNATKLAQLKARNEQLLAGFDKEELEEDFPGKR